MASISLATLLAITIPATGEVLRYQSYQLEAILFGDELYSYAAFEIKSYPKSDLSMGSEDAVIAIRNTQLARAMLRAYDNLRGAIVRIVHLQVGLAVPPIAWIMAVASTTTEGSAVIFSLKPQSNALSGALAGHYLSSRDFPSHPYYLPQL
jgi:hypothetical protein